jgi:hypothetical protein
MTRTFLISAVIAWPLYAFSDAIAPIIVPMFFRVWGMA